MCVLRDSLKIGEMVIKFMLSFQIMEWQALQMLKR